MKTIFIFLGIGGLLFLQSCTSQSTPKEGEIQNPEFSGGIGTGGILISTGGAHR